MSDRREVPQESPFSETEEGKVVTEGALRLCLGIHGLFGFVSEREHINKNIQPHEDTRTEAKRQEEALLTPGC